MAIKRYSQMTPEELVALTQEEIALQIDLECANQGSPLLPADPGPEPTSAIPLPDQQVYEIAGYTTSSIEHASAILTALNSGPLYNDAYARGNYDIRYMELITPGSYRSPEIKTKQLYSPTLWAEIKDTFSLQAQKQQEWSLLDKAYRQAVSDRQDITDEVYDAIRKAQQYLSAVASIEAQFEKYLTLAEGNCRVAYNFLNNGCRLLQDFPEIQERYRNLYMEN